MNQMDDRKKGKVKEIRLDQVPSIRDIKAIESKEGFVKWCEGFVAEVANHPERFPHSNLELVLFLGTLKNWAEKQVEPLCRNTGIMNPDELDWRTVAFVLRGVLQSHSDV